MAIEILIFRFIINFFFSLDFDKCFGEEETKTLQNKFSYASIESKICLAQAFVYCEKVLLIILFLKD